MQSPGARLHSRMNRETLLRRRIKLLTWCFIAGLVFSGTTALPLVTELDWMVQVSGARQLVESAGTTNAPAWAQNAAASPAPAG